MGCITIASTGRSINMAPNLMAPNGTIAQCLTEWGAERLTGWLTGWLTKSWLRGCFRLPGG